MGGNTETMVESAGTMTVTLVEGVVLKIMMLESLSLAAL